LKLRSALLCEQLGYCIDFYITYGRMWKSTQIQIKV